MRLRRLLTFASFAVVLAAVFFGYESTLHAQGTHWAAFVCDDNFCGDIYACDDILCGLDPMNLFNCNLVLDRILAWLVGASCFPF